MRSTHAHPLEQNMLSQTVRPNPAQNPTFPHSLAGPLALSPACSRLREFKMKVYGFWLRAFFVLCLKLGGSRGCSSWRKKRGVAILEEVQRRPGLLTTALASRDHLNIQRLHVDLSSLRQPWPNNRCVQADAGTRLRSLRLWRYRLTDTHTDNLSLSLSPSLSLSL